MNLLVAWLAKNPVFTNLLMAVIVLAGFVAIDRMPVQQFPDVNFPNINVGVTYLGAAPGDVDIAVCSRVEEQLRSVQGIDQLNSIASENHCNVLIEVKTDFDTNVVFGEVQGLVNGIDTFPEDTEKPVITLVEPSTVVAEIALVGPTDEAVLKELGRIVRDDMLRSPEIDQVDIANTRPYEISVEVSEASLRRNNLTFDQVAAAVRRGSVDMPGGSIRTSQGELLLRTTGQAYFGPEFEDLVVGARGDGTRILLKDVAEVVDGLADSGVAVRFNGRPAVLLSAIKVGSGDVRNTAEAVAEFLAEAPARYPEGVELILWEDTLEVLQTGISSLMDSGLQGLLLILVLLALFLRPALALWVTVGIPIALLGAVFLAYWAGFSIDTFTLVGFILVLGMMVDDAVVVGEQVFVEQRKGVGQLQAAALGAQKVLAPVVFGVLTTIAIFVPLLAGEGSVGVLMDAVAGVVIACLVFSLIECLTILPAHLAHSSERMPLGEFGLSLLVIAVLAAIVATPDLRTGVAASVVVVTVVIVAHRRGYFGPLAVAFAGLQRRIEDSLQAFIDGRLRNWAYTSLRHRRVSLAVGVAVFTMAVGFATSGHLPFAFMLPTPSERVVAQLTMPVGVDRSVTERAVAEMLDAVAEVERQVLEEYGMPGVEHIVETIGAHGRNSLDQIWLSATLSSADYHLAEVTLQLPPQESRPLSTAEYAERLRAEARAIPGVEKLVYQTNELDVGSRMAIRVFGDDIEQLSAASAEIRRRLAEFGGVFDIVDDFVTGKEEARFSITPAGEALGLGLADLGLQVRQAFYGEEAQRVQRGEDDIRVMVRYTEQERRSLDSLYDLRIRTPAGDQVPFSTVAEMESGVGQSVINRTDGMRAVTITASVDPAVTSANAVVGQLNRSYLQIMDQDFPRIGYEIESLQDQEKFSESVGVWYLYAFLAIYALLALPLNSFSQPFLILSVLPFTFIGAVFGHWLMSFYGNVVGFSMPSYLGVIGAGGVAVNANLVLLSAVNHYRAAGRDMVDSLVSGTVDRFRPIFMTTLTTFAGLIPMMLSTDDSLFGLINMVVAVAWGIMFGAVSSLFFMPALWLELSELRNTSKRATALARTVAGPGSRLNSWVARFPYVQESLRSKEFTDLSFPEDMTFADAAEEKIARQGLVQLYYAREFGTQQMREQLEQRLAVGGHTDDLAAEVKTWAQKRVFQLAVHIADGRIAPVSAAAPLSDILSESFHVLLRAVARDCAREQAVGGEACALIACGALGRREFAVGDPVELMFVGNGEAEAEEYRLRLARLIELLSSEGILFGKAEFFALPDSDGAARTLSLNRLRDYFLADPAPAELRWMAHARVISSEGDISAEFESLREEILSAPRNPREVAAYCAARREQLPESRWTAGTGVHSGRGGLPDLALAADYLLLSGAARARGATVPGTAEVFRAAAESGALRPDAAEQLADAAELWRNLDGFAKVALSKDLDATEAPKQLRKALADFCGAADSTEIAGIVAATTERTAALLERMSAEAVRSGGVA